MQDTLLEIGILLVSAIVIIIFSLFISLFTIGLKGATGEGYLLNKPYIYLERILPGYIFDCTIGCNRCMASFWNIVFFIGVIYGLNISTFFFLLLILTIPVTSAITIILTSKD